MAATVTTPEHVHLLRHVIASGDLPELKAQLQACDISPNSILVTEECSATLLHWACLSNRVPIARYLIDNGADLNVGESRANETPLQWAVRDDSFKELVQLLIDSGSDLKHKSAGGLDALRIACRLNNINIVYLLASSGADPNSLDDRGETVLHEILKAQYNEYMTDLMRLLISLGADCSIPDITGNNALHLICYYKTSTNRSKFVLAMLNAKPDGYKMLYQKNNLNLTPFGVCRNCNNYVMMRFLFDYFLQIYMPSAAPYVVAGLKTCAPYFALHFFGWSLEGIAIAVASFSLLGLISLPTVSSPVCGFAWGTIFLTEATYFLYCKNYYTWDVHCFVVFFCVATCYTLYQSMVTKCETLPCDTDRRELVRLMINEGKPDTDTIDGLNNEETTGLVAGSLDLEKGKDRTGKEVKLCTTCLSNKADADTHCSTCNKCVVCIDHHCPFVNNCVGRGNRRVFVLFTLFASLGCIMNALLSLWVFVAADKGECGQAAQHPTAPGETIDSVGAAFMNIICGFVDTPFLPLASIHTFVTGCWILSLCIYQLTMVATCTTTFQMIRGQRSFQRQPLNLIVSNLCEFFLTGKFRVIPYVGPKKTCCSGHHGPAHAHGHGHGHGHAQTYEQTQDDEQIQGLLQSHNEQAAYPHPQEEAQYSTAEGSYSDSGVEMVNPTVPVSPLTTTPQFDIPTGQYATLSSVGSAADIESVGTGLTSRSAESSVHSTEDHSEVRSRGSRSPSVHSTASGRSSNNGANECNTAGGDSDVTDCDEESGAKKGLLGAGEEESSDSTGWMTSMLLGGSKSKGKGQ